MYHNGYGVVQNYTEAVNWYRKSAEQGYAEAQNNLGWMYQNGYGVAQSYTEAVNWFRKSAEQGYAEAQYNLGAMYANGDGVAQNYTEAVKWFRKSAEQGYAEAQNNLGWMYYTARRCPELHRSRNGTGAQSKGMPAHKIIWARCMPMAKELNRTIAKQRNCTGKQQSKGTQKHNII